MDDIPVHVICTLFCVPCVMFVMISVSAGGGGRGKEVGVCKSREILFKNPSGGT